MSLVPRRLVGSAVSVVAVAVILAMAGCSSAVRQSGAEPESPSETPTSSATSSGPTPSATSATGTADPGPDAAFDGATPGEPSKFPGLVTDVGFQSPSGNITCGIQDSTVVCQIGEFDYTPPPHDCGGSGWGFNFGLKPTGPAYLFCAGDVESGGPTLGYGRKLSVGPAQCVSRRDGVTCHNTASGYGFRVSRDTYTFFGPGGAATTVGRVDISPALVGEWSGHGRSVTIKDNGLGAVEYRTYRNCDDDPTPGCDATTGRGIVPGGYIDFTLTKAVSRTEATGAINDSSDPKLEAGTAFTATVDGDNLTLSFWPDTPFCAPDTPPAKANCGA